MRLTILLVIFKKNSTVGLPEVSRLINAAISKRQGDQRKNNFFEKKKLFSPLMHNVPKWSDTLSRSCSICCKIFKVCLTILGYYALKGQKGKWNHHKHPEISHDLMDRTMKQSTRQFHKMFFVSHNV